MTTQGMIESASSELATRDAGRETDAIVASLVFGQKMPTDDEVRATAERIWKEQPDCFYFIDGFEAWRGTDGSFHWRPSVRPYSSEISAAWEVVAKLAREDCEFALFGPAANKDYWTADFDYADGSSSADAKTAPLAICLAAIVVCSAESESRV